MDVEQLKLRWSRVTLRECWRLSVGGKFPVYLGLKFGILRPSRMVTIPLCSAWPQVSIGDMAPAALRRMDKLLGPLIEAGFRTVAYGRTPVLERDRTLHCVLLIAPRAEIGASVGDDAQPGYTVTNASMTSRFSDDNYAISVNTPKTLVSGAKGMDLQYRPDLSAIELYEDHQQRLARLESAGKLAMAFRDEDAMPCSQEIAARTFAAFRARGLFVPMTDDEIEKHLDQHGAHRAP